MRSRHATRGRVIVNGITHRVYAVNSVGVGGTACGEGFSQRQDAARRNMMFGQRTSHTATVNCMACIAEGTGEREPAKSLVIKAPIAKTWIVFDDETRKPR